MKTVWVVLVISLCLVALTHCCDDKKCSKVRSVGGCDKTGTCGVTLEDGHTMIDFWYPSIGTEECYCEAKK